MPTWGRWLPLAIGFGGLLSYRPSFIGILRPRARAAHAAGALPETYVEATGATEATDGREGLYFQRHSRLAQHLFAENGLRSFATWRDWYQAPWWLQQGDVMTVLAGTLREVQAVACETHFVETSDGGILALDAFSLPGTGMADDAPVAVLIPGLGGSANGGYVRNMAFSLLHRGFHVLGLNMRGVGAAKLRTPRFASAHRGSTGDLREAVSYIRNTLLPGQSPRKVFAMGWSLGGNIVVNALAEQGPDHHGPAHLDGGVALCATHCLTRTARQYDEHWPMRHLYDPHVLRNLKKMLEPAMPFYRSGPVPSAVAADAVAVDHQRIASATRIRDIDEALIRRMFGYSSVEEYYHQASCSRRLADVTVPLLLISAADDPMTTSWVPLETVRSNEQVILAYTKHGGQIAWHDEKNVRKSHWVEDGVGSFLERLLTWHDGEG